MRQSICLHCLSNDCSVSARIVMGNPHIPLQDPSACTCCLISYLSSPHSLNQTGLLISSSFCSTLTSFWVLCLGSRQRLTPVLRKLSPLEHRALNLHLPALSPPLCVAGTWLWRLWPVMRGAGLGRWREARRRVRRMLASRGSVTNGSEFGHENGTEAARSGKQGQ